MHTDLVLAKVIALVLGSFVAFQGLRAYRREENSRMLFVAVGFLFISIGAVLEGVLYDIVHFSLFASGMIQTTVVIIGMLFVVISLYVRPERKLSNHRTESP